MLCNNERLDPDEFFPGGCRDLGDMLPLGELEVLGRAFPVQRRPIRVSRANYPSSDAMAVSQPKGFKRALCIETWRAIELVCALVIVAGAGAALLRRAVLRCVAAHPRTTPTISVQ